MSAFAYIGIFEVMIKLAVVLVLTVSPFDKLIFYAFLLFVVSVIIRFIYGIYCNRKFEECRIVSWKIEKTFAEKYDFFFCPGLLLVIWDIFVILKVLLSL